MHFVHDSCCMILFLSVKSLQEFFFFEISNLPLEDQMAHLL